MCFLFSSITCFVKFFHEFFKFLIFLVGLSSFSYLNSPFEVVLAKNNRFESSKTKLHNFKTVERNGVQNDSKDDHDNLHDSAQISEQINEAINLSFVHILLLMEHIYRLVQDIWLNLDCLLPHSDFCNMVETLRLVLD